MKKRSRLPVYVSLLAGIGLFLSNTPAFGLTDEEISILLQNDAAESMAENLARLNRWQTAYAATRDQLNAIKAEMKATEMAIAELETEYSLNERRLDELTAEMLSQAEYFGSFLQAWRSAAWEVLTDIRYSLSLPDYSGDVLLERIRRTALARRLPSLEELTTLNDVMMKEMIAQMEVVATQRFVDRGVADGEEETVFRVGSFTIFTVHDVEFLQIRDGLLIPTDPQPPSEVARAAMALILADEGEIVLGPINPTIGLVPDD